MWDRARLANWLAFLLLAREETIQPLAIRKPWTVTEKLLFLAGACRPVATELTLQQEREIRLYYHLLLPGSA
jgi:hypothetical protein